MKGLTRRGTRVRPPKEGVHYFASQSRRHDRPFTRIEERALGRFGKCRHMDPHFPEEPAWETELFFPEAERSSGWHLPPRTPLVVDECQLALAILTCDGCPVSELCRRWAMAAPESRGTVSTASVGIYGATRGQDRQQALRITHRKRPDLKGAAAWGMQMRILREKAVENAVWAWEQVEPEEEEE